MGGGSSPKPQRDPLLTNWLLLWLRRSLMVILVQGSGLWRSSSRPSRAPGDTGDPRGSPGGSSFTTTVGGHSGPSLSVGRGRVGGAE